MSHQADAHAALQHEDQPTVLSERVGTVLTVTLNRPRVKNAMTTESFELLGDVLRAAVTDDAVRVVVLTGAGGDFCSGADMNGVPVGHPLTRIRRVSRTAELLYTLPKPVIAKVEGVAVGAGWNLALCCDLVVASSDARFSAIFARRALSVDFGGSWLLPRLAGLQQAKRLAFLAEFVGAEEAQQLGLVTWVVPSDELDAFVDDLAKRVAAMPPLAVAQTKELMNSAAAGTLGQALLDETRAQVVNYASEDALAARRAFQDKTEPVYTGGWTR